VESPPAPVTVTDFELRAYDPPFIDFRADCSSGTYIRSLAHDLGTALGCGAHLAALERTRIGEFGLDAARSMEEIQAAADRGDSGAFLIPMEALLPEIPAFALNEEGAARIRDGRPVEAAAPDGQAVAPPLPNAVVRLLGPDGKLIALARPSPAGNGVLAPFLVLL
jgi:tRNA pseudouridine55 synthase